MTSIRAMEDTGGIGSFPADCESACEMNDWVRVGISQIEDLKDAVYGAGLSAMQMARAPVTGTLLFAEHDGMICTSGLLGGRVAVSGPLSESMITFGVGLSIAPGTRHWLKHVATGAVGVFLPGDEHDALYYPGSLYATIALSPDRLEDLAASVLNAGIVHRDQRLIEPHPCDRTLHRVRSIANIKEHACLK